MHFEQIKRSLVMPEHFWLAPHTEEVAVLSSGGVESCVLVAALASIARRVHPLYFRCGLKWESAEESQLRHFLAQAALARVSPLTVLSLPVSDVYDSHWSITGEAVPGHETADSAVYLPGRNLLFSAKAALWCAINNVPIVALGSL
ncbi:MAG: 7-cyano-7-deazaguanine synthase, partial [Terriglobales bacterium]